MTQIEFVTELEQALRGNVEERIIQENVRYYNDYISEQRAAGKSEEEIFASLEVRVLLQRRLLIPPVRQARRETVVPEATTTAQVQTTVQLAVMAGALAG